MLREMLPRLIKGENLTQDEARGVMLRIMAGDAGTAETAALVTALSIKGETVEEVAGFAQAMREGAEPFPTRSDMLVDTCGTGGDRTGTFNISTTAAFVAAAAGLIVAKHGNRSVTSKSGSSDVLEALGVAVDLPLDLAVGALDAVGMTFLFAPKWHPAMRHVAPVRRELPFPTVFNLLGPLSNPARPRAQLLGVHNPALTGFMARVLAILGTERALVVHGAGLDEVSVCGPTAGYWLADGVIARFKFDPAELGWAWADPDELLGGGPEDNARIVRGILDGSITGAKRRAVLLNAAAALAVAGKADQIVDAVPLAEAAIDSG
ncbi:MAG: anthranilate phosphoribosyltransferase, partial [Candidatus Sericytochromatia bacterium]|nr:anthranilate phosphoribosyltransferase [Candidatus Sericytochromatia bacterium]